MIKPCSWRRGVRQASDEIEQPIAARLDASAVLDVCVRPQARRRFIIAFIEKGVESFEHQSSVLIGSGFH
jgi:hypothetical protein